MKETKAGQFSAEDQENVVIPCALSAIAYEIYPNLISILKSQKAY